jgi:flagellar basal-body rod protein FlgB
MASANGSSHGALGLTPSKSALQGGFSAVSNTRHMALAGNSEGRLVGQEKLGYAIQSQPSLDGNSVDLDQERANFVDNSVHYEATLRFINGQSKTILSAIQGQ